MNVRGGMFMMPNVLDSYTPFYEKLCVGLPFFEPLYAWYGIACVDVGLGTWKLLRVRVLI